jgi:acyl carrier protein
VADRPETAESEPRLNIYQRISAIQAVLDTLEKDSEVKTANNKKMYDYVSHDAVTTHIRAAMIEQGVIAIPTVKEHRDNGNRIEIDLQVDYVSIDDKADRIGILVVGYGADNSDKGPGKAMSYALKVAHLKMFMLSSYDDSGGEEVEHQGAASKADVAAAKEETAQAQARVNERDKALATRLVADLDAADSIEKVEALMAEHKKFLANLPDDTATYIRNKAGEVAKQMEEE